MRKLFLSFLLAILVPMMAEAKEMYAVYNGDAMTYSFYYDNNRASRIKLYGANNVVDLTPSADYPEDYALPAYGNPNFWFYTKKAVFDASFADARPTTTYGWFYGIQSMTEIEGIEYLNTSEVTDMRLMFSDCSSLTSLDVSHFDTGKVTDMSYMFYRCSSLTSLDVSHFDTGNVTDMSYMFEECSALTALDVSHFNTGKVTTMENMFIGCSSLTSLDVSHFDTGKVTWMIGMFCDCSALTTIDVSHFNTGNVGSMKWMFMGCSSLTSLDVSHFDTGKVTEMERMFKGCSSLKVLDVSSFDTSGDGYMAYMFADCESLTTIYCNDDWFPDWYMKDNYSKQYGYMFQHCSNLVGGAGTKYDGRSDVKMAHPDTKDNPGYFTLKDGSEVTPDGDLTQDGKMDADDVVTLVALILSKDLKADMNHDGKMDIADLVWLVNLILDKK